MEYIKMQNSDLIVSRLCMGGCPLGGYGWGKVSEKEMIEAVHSALDAGVTMFDTADTYGLGYSELLLGKAVSGYREKIVIASKFGVRVENGKTFYDNSPEWINIAIDNSLKRLSTDYIDLYQVHYRDRKTPIAQVIWTLEELKRQGKIRYYGVSNIHEDDLGELKEYKGKLVSFQDEYSLACRKNEADIIRLSEELEMTPLTWGSLGQGILTGKYDKNCYFEKDDRRSRETYVNFHGEKLLKNLQIVEMLKEIASEVKRPISSVAIRFILDHLPGSIVLAGMKNSEQLNKNCMAFGWKLNRQQLKKLDKISQN